MRDFFEHALALVRRVRRIHPAAQDGVSSVLLCVLVVALIFQATPPRFLLGPLLNFAAPSSDTYSATAPRVVAGSPELDDAPSVEVAADGVASTPSLTETVRAEDRRQKIASEGRTVATTDTSGGGGTPTTSGSGTTSMVAAAPPPAPSPIGPCHGNASASSLKHASSNGLRNGTGHGYD